MMILIFFVLIWSFDQNSAFTCSDSVCQNGGTCIQIGKDLAYCICINGYTGEKCNDVLQETTAAPTSTTTGNICFEGLCRNGGKCKELSSNFAFCQCTPGYFGIFCEDVESTTETTTSTTTSTSTKSSQLKMCPSGMNVCKNDGICLFTDAGSILCRCQLPYTGVFCENKNKFCDLKPCKNGGSCIDKEGDEIDGECLCAESYFGKTCDTRNCVDDFCVKGTCLEIGGEKSCFCFNGYTGEKCDIAQNE